MFINVKILVGIDPKAQHTYTSWENVPSDTEIFQKIKRIYFFLNLRKKIEFNNKQGKNFFGFYFTSMA